MKTDLESSNWMRVRSVAAGFLCVMGLPVALALADVHDTVTAAAPSVIESTTDAAPAQQFHIANSGLDTGPGSDEALLVSSAAAR